MLISVICPGCKKETGVREAEDVYEGVELINKEEATVLSFHDGAHIHCPHCGRILKLKIIQHPSRKKYILSVV